MSLSLYIKEFLDSFDYFLESSHNDTSSFIIDLKIMKRKIEKSIREATKPTDSELTRKLRYKLKFMKRNLNYCINSVRCGGVGENDSSLTIKQLKEKLKIYVYNNFKNYHKS